MNRILIFIPNMNMGGAQKALLSLLNELPADQYGIKLVVFDKSGDLLKIIPENVCVEYWENYYDIIRKNKYSDSVKNDIIKALKQFDLRYALQKMLQVIIYKSSNGMHEEQRVWRTISYRIEKRKIDGYDLCLSYMQGTATYYLVDKVVTNCPKLAMINTDYIKAGYSKKFDKKYFNKLYKLGCVSEHIERQIKQVFPEITDKVMYVGDIVSPKSIIARSQENCPVVFDRNYLNVVSCGRLVVQTKGYDLCIEAARLLKDDGIEFRWYIIGDGDGRKWMEERIKALNLTDNVFLLGTIINPYPIVSRGDIFVQASRFEGKPISVREAIILKKNIVCTKFASASSEIRDGENGFLVDINSTEIYKAIKNIYLGEVKQKIEDRNDDIDKELQQNMIFLHTE